MMMRHLLLLSAAALALSACGGRADTENTATANMAADNFAMASNDPVTDAPVLAAVDFVPKAAMSDMYEIESSKLALKSAADPKIKAFAQQMIDGHTKTTAELKAAIKQDNVIVLPPAKLDAEHQALVDALKGAKGPAFDTIYRTQQLDSHAKALALHQGHAGGGDKSALKAFAAATAPKVKMHLDMLKAMPAA